MKKPFLLLLALATLTPTLWNAANAALDDTVGYPSRRQAPRGTADDPIVTVSRDEALRRRTSAARNSGQRVPTARPLEEAAANLLSQTYKFTFSFREGESTDEVSFLLADKKLWCATTLKNGKQPYVTLTGTVSEQSGALLLDYTLNVGFSTKDATTFQRSRLSGLSRETSDDTRGRILLRPGTDTPLFSTQGRSYFVRVDSNASIPPAEKKELLTPPTKNYLLTVEFKQGDTTETVSGVIGGSPVSFTAPGSITLGTFNGSLSEYADGSLALSGNIGDSQSGVKVGIAHGKLNTSYPVFQNGDTQHLVKIVPFEEKTDPRFKEMLTTGKDLRLKLTQKEKDGKPQETTITASALPGKVSLSKTSTPPGEYSFYFKTNTPSSPSPEEGKKPAQDPRRTSVGGSQNYELDGTLSNIGSGTWLLRYSVKKTKRSSFPYGDTTSVETIHSEIRVQLGVAYPLFGGDTLTIEPVE